MGVHLCWTTSLVQLCILMHMKQQEVVTARVTIYFCGLPWLFWPHVMQLHYCRGWVEDVYHAEIGCLSCRKKSHAWSCSCLNMVSERRDWRLQQHVRFRIWHPVTDDVSNNAFLFLCHYDNHNIICHNKLNIVTSTLYNIVITARRDSECAKECAKDLATYQTLLYQSLMHICFSINFGHVYKYGMPIVTYCMERKKVKEKFIINKPN